MEITASLVKELRERTGAGMMECKKALTEANGDIDAAAEAMRKSGAAKADKKADRVAAEGRLGLAQDGGKAVLVEVNSETDFVANDDNFKSFVNAVAAAALATGANDIEAVKAAKLDDGRTVEEARATAVQTLGENIQIRRLVKIDRRCRLRSHRTADVRRAGAATGRADGRTRRNGHSCGRPVRARRSSGAVATAAWPSPRAGRAGRGRADRSLLTIGAPIFR